MKNKNRVSFKKHAPLTGLMSIGYSKRPVDIKINGKKCGYISAPNWRSSDRFWHIRLQVYLPAERVQNCKWEWIILTTPFETEQGARDYLKANIDDVIRTLPDLYFQDED